jgi:hypothetical protein
VIILKEILGKIKKYMSNKEHFADIFNYYAHQGKRVVNPENLKPIDESSIVFPFNKNDEDYEQEYLSMMKNLTAIMEDDENIYNLVGTVTQSYAMPARNMLFDAALYAQQQGENIKPVVTLVVHWSPDDWDGPTSKHEMLTTKDEYVLAVIPDYKLKLVIPYRMNDEDFEKFATPLGTVLKCVKYSKDKSALEQVIKDCEKTHPLDKPTEELINVVTGYCFE